MTAAANAIVLNGSHGEGGSALLRTAVAMSVLTQQPLRVHGIRGATRRPGLTSEDLSYVRTLGKLCMAEIEGDEAGGESLRLEPAHAIRPLTLDVDTQHQDAGEQPGHAAVIGAALVPVLARAAAYSDFSVFGETHSAGALNADSFELGTCWIHRAQGLYVFPSVRQAGYGYGSRGRLGIEVEPSHLEPLRWETRGELQEIICRITVSGLSDNIVQRGKSYAQKLGDELKLPVRAEVMTPNASDPGAFVVVAAHCERGCATASAMGAKGVRIESLIKRCFEEIQNWLSGSETVDPFLADQILLPAVLAYGSTIYKTSSVTRRLITMAWVIKQFMPVQITILGREGEPGTVTVN